MSLHEFDALTQKMQLAFDYAANLGQYIEAAKVLYQMNDQLPDDLQLSLEELENENGRVYHITVEASDGELSCTGVITVGVPHDKKDTPIDDGALFDSTN